MNSVTFVVGKHINEDWIKRNAGIAFNRCDLRSPSVIVDYCCRKEGHKGDHMSWTFITHKLLQKWKQSNV
jgi:hypothetical protein